MPSKIVDRQKGGNVIIVTNGIILNVQNLDDPNLTFSAKTIPSPGPVISAPQIVAGNVKLLLGMVEKSYVIFATIHII